MSANKSNEWFETVGNNGHAAAVRIHKTNQTSKIKQKTPTSQEIQLNGSRWWSTNVIFAETVWHMISQTTDNRYHELAPNKVTCGDVYLFFPFFMIKITHQVHWKLYFDGLIIFVILNLQPSHDIFGIFTFYSFLSDSCWWFHHTNECELTVCYNTFH